MICGFFLLLYFPPFSPDWLSLYVSVHCTGSMYCTCTFLGTVQVACTVRVRALHADSM